jgi:hypothetical protein
MREDNKRDMKKIKLLDNKIVSLINNLKDKNKRKKLLRKNDY